MLFVRIHASRSFLLLAALVLGVCAVLVAPNALADPSSPITLTNDDILRRDVIMSLMCNLELDRAAVSRQYEIDFDEYFAGVDEKLAQPIPRLESSIEMTFLRIAQEALMNIARHAQATQVNIALWQEEDAILMTIQDNGIGIQSWQEANRPGSHGLTIMRERAEAFGGSFHVQSVAGQGTKIEVSIPLKRQRKTYPEKTS